MNVGADFHLGAPGAEYNPVYFSSHDFTHLTDVGYAIVGQDAAAAVRHLHARPPDLASKPMGRIR